MQIENVFKQNLSKTFTTIQRIIKQYPIIAIDTEFPGFFTDPLELSLKLGKNLSKSCSSFELFCHNINNLKLIQLGIAFCDAQGNFPKPAAFSFYFKFDIDNDICTDQSRVFLKENFKANDLRRFKEEGIDPVNFSNLFLTSGLCYNPQLKYIVFHGNQDVGYLIRALTQQNIKNLQEFKQQYQSMLNKVYDLKTVINWEFGLQNLAEKAQISREGFEHQAGSDALLTLKLFMKEGNFANEGEIHGLDE